MPRDRRQRGQRQVRIDTGRSRIDAVAPAILRQVRDAERDRLLAASADEPRWPFESHRRRRSRGSRPKSTRASSVRPAPTSPARPTISPRRTVQADVAERRRSRDDRPSTFEHGRRRSTTSRFGKTASTSRPTISRIRCGLGDLGHLVRADRAAVAEHRHAVGQPRQLLEAMRDVDDRRRPARAARRAGRTGDRLPAASATPSARRGSAGGRWRPSARAISTSCCSGRLSDAASRSTSIRAPTASSSASRPSRRAGQSTRDHAPPRFDAEREVLRDAEIGKQRRVLVNGDHAQPPRLERRDTR